MSAPPFLFLQPDFPSDASFVLVLVEASGIILDYWNDLTTHYLPHLLNAIQAGNKTRPVRVCWQLTSDAPGLSCLETQGQIPDFQFDLSSSHPVDSTALRRCLQTVKLVPRQQGWTRHFIIVGVSAPFPNEGQEHSPEPISVHDTCQGMAHVLAEEGIRTHMILSVMPEMQPLRDIFNCQLRYRSSTEVPSWFYVDQNKVSVHLMPAPFLHDPAFARRSILPLNPIVDTTAAVATSISSGLPPVSPAQEVPALVQSQSSSPPSRRSRLHTDSSSSPPSPSTSERGKLVSYLQKVHGMSKKRTSSAKLARRSTSNEPTRASSSSRPILPRLTLPPQTMIAARPSDIAPKVATAIDVAGTPTTPSANEPLSSSANGPPRGEAMKGPRQDSQSPSRWPYLRIPPMTMAHEGPGFGESAKVALRSLESIAPKPPLLGAQLSGDQLLLPNSGSPVRTTFPAPLPGLGIASQQQFGGFHATTSPHAFTAPLLFPSNSVLPSSPQFSAAIAQQAGLSHGRLVVNERGVSEQRNVSHGPDDYAVGASHASHASTSSQRYPVKQYAYPQQIIPVQPYTTSPAGQSGASLPPPSVAEPAASVNEGEDQPFVITPEYEALANARFEEAIRSGAMQASMTPAALSPGITFPTGANGYFSNQVTPPPDRIIASGPGFQQTPVLSQPNYTYPLSQSNPQGHALYQQQQPGPSASDSGPTTYYAPPASSLSGHQWYGSQ